MLSTNDKVQIYIFINKVERLVKLLFNIYANRCIDKYTSIHKNLTEDYKNITEYKYKNITEDIYKNINIKLENVREILNDELLRMKVIDINHLQ